MSTPTVYVLVDDPSYVKTAYDSSTFDLSFRIDQEVSIFSGASFKLKTGVKTFSDSVDFLMVPRSSSGRLSKGLFHIEAEPYKSLGIEIERPSSLKLANTVGVIDRDYKGEWIAWVQVEAHEEDNFVLVPGNYYLQAVPLSPCSIQVVTSLNDVPEALRTSSRGEGGFGSSGA